MCPNHIRLTEILPPEHEPSVFTNHNTIFLFDYTAFIKAALNSVRTVYDYAI